MALNRERQCLGRDIYVIKETRFYSGDYVDILTKRTELFAAYYDDCS